MVVDTIRWRTSIGEARGTKSAKFMSAEKPAEVTAAAAVSWRGAALMLAKSSRGCGCDALQRVANSADLLREILTPSR